MTKYYVYHCSISEIDVENNEVNSLLEAHSDDTKVHTNKQEAVNELRNILDKHCTVSLTKEIERLNRVIAVLDRNVESLNRKIAHAATVPV